VEKITPQAERRTKNLLWGLIGFDILVEGRAGELLANSFVFS